MRSWFVLEVGWRGAGKLLVPTSHSLPKVYQLSNAPFILAFLAHILQILHTMISVLLQVFLLQLFIHVLNNYGKEKVNEWVCIKALANFPAGLTFIAMDTFHKAAYRPIEATCRTRQLA
jgi:hypothetical protein